MRRLFAACAVIFVAAPAAADIDDPQSPKPLRVSARLDGDTARFTVRYVLRTENAANEATAISPEVFYDLPERGLVTAATVSEGGRTHVLALTPAETADQKLGALRNKPVGRAKTWALVIADHDSRGVFTIQSVAPRQATLVLDTEIAAPTCFRRDARYVAVPPVWASRIPAELRGPVNDAELETACSEVVLEDVFHTWMKFPAHELARRPGGADRIATHAGRLSLGKTQIVKLEMDLAARISEIPSDLATAILVDVSRSMTADELEAQRETIAAYLRAAPNSRVQVIAYSRRARALLPSWTLASHGAVRIERELRAIARSNGSNIDAGLREAGVWLDQTTGTRRIVLFTDEHLSTKSEHSRQIDDAVPAHTLVHVVALGNGALVRDDEATLSRVAAPTRGMLVRGGDMADGAALDATLLVRPITLDHVRIKTPGWKAIHTDPHACPANEGEFKTSLVEGESCTWWGRGDAVSAPFTVEGFLWGEQVNRVVRADLDRSREVAREVSAMHVLEDELQKLAERAARAVNSVWSLYVEWGGNDGYGEAFGSGGSGWGSTCAGCDSGDIGHGFGFGTMGNSPDLAAELSRIARTCQPSHPVSLEVETTLEEIVGVEVDTLMADTRTCIEEALWNAWLVAPGAPSRTVTKVRVSR